MAVRNIDELPKLAQDVVKVWMTTDGPAPHSLEWSNLVDAELESLEEGIKSIRQFLDECRSGAYEAKWDAIYAWRAPRRSSFAGKFLHGGPSWRGCTGQHQPLVLSLLPVFPRSAGGTRTVTPVGPRRSSGLVGVKRAG